MAAVFTVQRPLATSSEMRPPYLYDKTDLFYNSMELCGNFTECWLLKLLESSLTWESPRDEVVLNKPANLTSRD